MISSTPARLVSSEEAATVEPIVLASDEASAVATPIRRDSRAVAPQSPFIIASIRRAISSLDTCSTTAQMDHLLPLTSFTVALR